MTSIHTLYILVTSTFTLWSDDTSIHLTVSRDLTVRFTFYRRLHDIAKSAVRVLYGMSVVCLCVCVCVVRYVCVWCVWYVCVCVVYMICVVWVWECNVCVRVHVYVCACIRGICVRV